MSLWSDIIDHKDDPGRYTLVRGDGLVVTANSNGSIVCQRKARNPKELVKTLCREPGIQIVPPAEQAALLKKINLHLSVRK